MTYLASSGDEAKIWDAPTFSLVEQFNAHDGPINDISWSHDGNYLATCCITDKKVNLRLTKGTRSIPAHTVNLPTGCSCLDFNSYSRFLLCGCVDGAIHIWDLKTQTLKKTYSKNKYPVTAARWNWNDTYIALASENGEIILLNVVTSQVSSPLTTPSNQAINQMKYNPYRKASLVTTSNDGVVNFWDTNTRRLLHSFTNTHQAPAKDLAFSPINDFLMVSVGLDKRAVFYDVQNKSSVKTIIADHPLTSVDMMHDGSTVVVGTTRGTIFFYDMRQESTPVFSLNAHKSSVRRLSFFKKENQTHASQSSQNLSRKLPTIPATFSETHNQNTNNRTYMSSPRSTMPVTGLEIFSPLGEGNKSTSSVTDKTGSERSWMMNKSLLAGDITTGDSIFSPIRNTSHSVDSMHGTSSFLDNSIFAQVLGSAETSHSDQPHVPSVIPNHVHDTYNAGLHPILPAPMSSSPHAMTPPRGNHIQHLDKTSPSNLNPQALSKISPGLEKVSPSRQKLSPHIQRAQRLTYEDDLSVDQNLSATNGTTESGVRYDSQKYSEGVTLKSALNSSSVQKPFHHSASPASDRLLQNSSAETTTSSLRHLVHGLLNEQFQEHHEHLKSEIRLMLGQSGVANQAFPPPALQANTGSVSHQINPEIYHAEFIRNLIREELDDMKDFIHKEFWCVQVEVIKQAFHLQQQMMAGFAECSINPILLDEIERLREENARLKKTF
ncbi:unnamed protein product [Lymnaea stagnalis]|uniref:NEDD1 n=1 Tax=Lymnaea stagnalis TaxID=6523 RepID=A0AAV2HD62_LYMST